MKTKKEVPENLKKFIEKMNEVKASAEKEDVFLGIYNAHGEHLSLAIHTSDEVDLIATFAFMISRYIYNECGKQEGRLVEAILNGLIATLTEPTPESLGLAMKIIKPIIAALRDEMEKMGIHEECESCDENLTCDMEEAIKYRFQNGMMKIKDSDWN